LLALAKPFLTGSSYEPQLRDCRSGPARPAGRRAAGPGPAPRGIHPHPQAVRGAAERHGTAFLAKFSTGS
jgi:hypothetical protein